MISFRNTAPSSQLTAFKESRIIALAKKQRIPHKFQPWIAVRKQFKLSDAHVQMARELGMNPKNFARYADTKNKPWKVPLSQFIEALYVDRFKRVRPEQIVTIEQMAAEHLARREAKKAAKEENQEAVEVEDDGESVADA
ncbi:hypothetical protein Pla22_30970 [Rubripirellula amarantea]|uniref:Uncharacterized protein n=1 Tax=Rubripirellula amarantea TaxID=2527999 RepID=A0A5C5WJR0_9BACT|nr:hypothetical protein [Rubripirellula amarantea]TWT50355.1 hypothetical protein Pla22_30970 [Rubripirellula amarantea]